VEPFDPGLDDFGANREVVRRWALLGVTILTFGVGALLLVPRDGSQAVVTDAVLGATGSQAQVPNAESPTSAPTDELDQPVPSIAWQSLDVSGGPNGTERVVLVFDNDLPKAPVVFVGDVRSPEPSAVSYTTQESRGDGPGGDGMSVCGSTHWFPSPGNTSVDVLLPTEWFAPGAEAYQFQGPVRIDPPGAMIGKIFACQYQGFVQFVVWGSASDNPADVTVLVEGKTLTIEIAPR